MPSQVFRRTCDQSTISATKFFPAQQSSESSYVNEFLHQDTFHENRPLFIIFILHTLLALGSNPFFTETFLSPCFLAFRVASKLN